MRYSQAGPSLARLRIFEPTTSWPARPPARIALSVAGFQNFGQQAAKTMGVFLMKQVRARLGPNPETSCLFGTLLSIIRTLLSIIRNRIATVRPFFGPWRFAVWDSVERERPDAVQFRPSRYAHYHRAPGAAADCGDEPFVRLLKAAAACHVSKSIGKIRRWH